MYRRFLQEQEGLNPHVKVIGLTATPYRLGQGLLTQGNNAIFEDIVYDANVGELVKQGYLAPLVAKGSTAKADLTAVKVRGGEYVADHLAAACDQSALIKQAIDEVMWYGEDRKSWLLFCASVLHAQHVRDEIRSRGIICEMVDADTPADEREKILSDFKDGRIRALTNCNVLTTGFNHPGIDLIAMLRPTKSTSLYVQMLGRGMRNAPGKVNCLVLDFASNVSEHGPIDMIQVVKKGTGAKSTNEVTTAPVKECPECCSIVHAAVRHCPDCGYEWPREVRHDTVAGDIAPLGVTSRWFEVSSVHYQLHTKQGSPDSVRVVYFCGLNNYSEWICVEHRGYAQEKAWHWWTKHVDNFMPTTAAESVKRLNDNPPAKPSRIKVKIGGKYPEITKVEFDDHNRGTGVPAEHLPQRCESDFDPHKSRWGASGL